MPNWNSSDAGHDPQGEIDEKECTPETRHAEPRRILGFNVTPFHPGHQYGKSQGQGHEDEMEHAGDGKLQPAQHQNIHTQPPFISSRQIIIRVDRLSSR